MTDVRPAVLADRAAVLDLCRLLHEEIGQHPIDWPKVEAMLDRCLVQAGGFVGVIGPIGEPVGAIMMVFDQAWYTREFHLLEIFNFVAADHRRTDYAKSLIAYAKKCADALQIRLNIGVVSDVRLEAKTRMYARMLPRAGEIFRYRPPRDGDQVTTCAEVATAFD